MNPAITLQSLPLILFLATLYSCIPAFLLACILLFVPALRRNLITRSLGILCAIVAAITPVSGLIVFVQFGTTLASQSLGKSQRTHRLSSPQTFAGILFPAGSTVVLQKDHPNFIDTASVPAPTLVHGLLLRGTFSMPGPTPGAMSHDMPNDSTGSLSGTLAQPATIAGVPCAAAPININDTFTSCMLAHSVELHGFSLASGTFVQTRLQPSGEFMLEQASLAVPTPLFGAVYPAGTIFTPDELTATRAAHLPYPETGVKVVCLPPGGQVTLGGAVLTGPVTLRYSSDNAQVGSSCPYKAGGQDTPIPDTPAGFGLFNNIRFVQGLYDPKLSTWTTLYNTDTPNIGDPPLERQ